MKNNKLYVTLSFDDGRKDTYEYAFNILKKYNLTATVHVITGYVDGTWEKKGLSSSYAACSIDELKEMKTYGIEISSHGDKHVTETNDLNTSLKKLDDWQLINDSCGFSAPNSIEDSLTEPSFQKNLKDKNISYIRVGKNLEKLSILKKIWYVLYRITKFNCFYLLYNKINVNCIHNFDKMHIISVPVKKKDKVSSIVKLINSQMSNDKWIVFMFHSILPSSHDYYNNDVWAYDIDKFEQICQYLNKLVKANKLNVDTIINIVGGH